MRVRRGGVDCHPCSRRGGVKEQGERENAKKPKLSSDPFRSGLTTFINSLFELVQC